MGAAMAERASVTCRSCGLKFFARPDGTCPRCRAAQDAPEDASPPAEVSNPGPKQRPYLAPMAWIGGIAAILVGVSAVWTPPAARDGGSVGTPAAAECVRIAGIMKQGGAAIDSLVDASKKRSNDINAFMTMTDFSKELDKIANELTEVSVKDPSLKSAAGEHAAILRRIAEHLRDANVTIRSGDRNRVKALMDKQRQLLDEEKASLEGIAGLCGWQRQSDTRSQ